MTNIQPIVDSVTIGNVSAFIDCVWLKCIKSFNFKVSMESIPIICDWASGKVAVMRGNPSGDITIEAMNLNSTTLKYALDAVVRTKTATDDSVDCAHVDGLVWVPDNALTPTSWTVEVNLNSPNIDNVAAYTTASGCAAATPTDIWASGTTPLNTITETDACHGVITLTTNDVDEAVAELWFTFDYSVDLATGATIIEPPYLSAPEDHLVIAWHLNKTTSEYYIYIFPRCQIVPDFSASFDNSNNVVTVPIHLEVLADTTFHPEAPLGWIEITDTLPAYLAALI